ncbi:hypothetical protein [Allofournierella sp.]|uniref:hypothetical protein n=1 Tax=Allofournierella sp. TaxID=1940256 RepID=UPI003AF1BA61
MDYTISPQKIEEMKEFLRLHPIDPVWDEEAMTFDGVLPPDEDKARDYRMILRHLGEID